MFNSLFRIERNSLSSYTSFDIWLTFVLYSYTVAGG